MTSATPPRIAVTAPTVHRFVEVDQVEVFYRESLPERPDAPVVLLLHGFPSASHQFRRLIDTLGRHYRLIAPDYPGFGHTRTPDGFTYSYPRRRPGRPRPVHPGRHPRPVRGRHRRPRTDRPRGLAARPALSRPARPQAGAARACLRLQEQHRRLPRLAGVAAQAQAAGSDHLGQPGDDPACPTRPRRHGGRSALRMGPRRTGRLVGRPRSGGLRRTAGPTGLDAVVSLAEKVHRFVTARPSLQPTFPRILSS